MADLGIQKNLNKMLWEKGDFTRIAETMRQSGSRFRRHARRSPGNDGARPRLRGRHDGDSGSGVLRRRPRHRHRRQSRRRRQCPRQDVWACERPLPAGRCVQPGGNCRRTLRPRRQHLRRDVRSEAVRSRQGDGARHQAGRADRHGQLDPERSDARGPDPEDQRRLHAAASDGLYQPDALGRRRPGARPASRSPASARRTSPSSARPGASASTVRRASCWRSSATITVRP